MRSGWGQVPAVLLYGTSRQPSTLWLTGNVSWYRICVHRLPHRTCVCWLPHRTNIVFCLCWLPHRTNPGFLLNGWLRDKVWFVSQEPTVYFGSCDSIGRLHQVHFSPWLQHGQLHVTTVGYHGVKFIHCILCLESIKHRYTFSLNLLWCKAVSSANNEIQSCRSQQFFGCSNLVASIRCILQKFALLHSRKKLDTMERQILLWCSNLGHFFMSVAKLSLARVSRFCSRGPY